MKETTINFSDDITFCEKRLSKKIVKMVLQQLKQPLSIEVCVSIVDDEQIKKLNKETRNTNKVTDVLSYPSLQITAGEKIPQNSVFGKTYLGDIIICRPQIKRQAAEYSVTYKQEFSRMVLHSMLHLLGYDHIKEDDDKVMKAVELPLLQKITKIKLI